MKRNIFQKQDDSEMSEPVEKATVPETKVEVNNKRKRKNKVLKIF